MSIKSLVKENFNTEVLDSSIPIIIDFWAEFCGPCKMLSPVIEELATEMSHVKFLKVDVEDQAELASDNRVVSIPTLLIFHNGKEIERKIGALPKAALKNWINSSIAK